MYIFLYIIYFLYTYIFPYISISAKSSPAARQPSSAPKPSPQPRPYAQPLTTATQPNPEAKSPSLALGYEREPRLNKDMRTLGTCPENPAPQN